MDRSIQNKAAGNKNSVVLHVAANDLIHEFLLSLCLVLSVIAVLTPILLLASVKVGFIDRLRQNFINDPTFREIRPGSADLRSEELFEQIRTWQGIAYAIPTVMMNPREVAVQVTNSDGRYRDEVRLLPSTADDPLLHRLKGEPPKGDGVVVTENFAQSAGIAIGDSFTITVTRIENDQRKRVKLDVAINGLIPSDALPAPTILGVPELEKHVENFRAGVAVPDRGWEGMESDPRLAYSFIAAAAPEPLGELIKSTLAIRVGTSKSEQISDVDLAALIGSAGPVETNVPASEYWMLTPGNSAYSRRDLTEANNVLRNSDAFALGIHPPREMQILGQTISAFGLPEALHLDEELGEVEGARSLGNSFRLNDRIVLPESLRSAYLEAGSPDRINVIVEFARQESTERLDLIMRPSGFIRGDSALVSGVLMAMLERGRQVKLSFDASNSKIVEQSSGFRGFRVIGTNIDIIPEIVRKFESEGIKVRAKSSQILKLQRLERSLNILVLVVSAVALIGGYSILTSSFFANVQRKKVNFATMRLIGMSKGLIFRIPIAQAIIISSLGFLLSICCYLLISYILNQFIAVELNFDGQLSKLYLSHYVFAGIFVIAGACIASLAASRAATQIDPAEALRSD